MPLTAFLAGKCLIVGISSSTSDDLFWHSATHRMESSVSDDTTNVLNVTGRERAESLSRVRGLPQLDEGLSARIEELLEKAEAVTECWERYGLAKLDENMVGPLNTFRQIRHAMSGEGRKRADQLVALLNRICPTPLTGGTFSEHVTSGLEHLESVFSKLEQSIVPQTLQKALVVARSGGLLTLDELPPGWRDNPYILTGYRFCANPKECIVSIVRIHNETCNIWTHILAFAFVLGLALWDLPHTQTWQLSTWADRIPMIVFVVAAMKCLLLSVVWHTFNHFAHYAIKTRIACVDYTGITVLITASILTTEYTVLNCHPTVRNCYMLLTTLGGIGGVAFTLTPSFDTPENRHIRALFFVAFAVAGAAGGIHAMFYRGILPTIVFYLPIIKSLLSYTVGVLIYAMLIPERWMPGSIFDYIGMSHNIWHVCVFAGIYYHYQAMMKFYEVVQAAACA